jgi:hypothetical protein
MPQYRFVTVWRLHAPIDRVYAELDDAEAWPTWWPNVRRVEPLERGDADGIGARCATAWSGSDDDWVASQAPTPARTDGAQPAARSAARYSSTTSAATALLRA